jgi:formiminoglutamase
MTPRPEDPNWPRASAWLSGECLPAAATRLGVLGIPLRLGSITPGRCDLAPPAIRAALDRYSTFDFELACDVRGVAARDLGDWDVSGLRPEGAFRPVADAVQTALRRLDALALLGGDNSITRPGCHGLDPELSSCALLTLDAHLDLRDLGALTNGNPVRALLTDGIPGSNIAQVGIQSFANSPAYAEVARQAGVTVVTVEQVRARGIAEVIAQQLEILAGRAEAIYVDFDLDVLDRGSAPAAPGSRPGGLLPWEVRAAARICGAHPKVRVMDLVEIDPEQDVAGVTSLTAAACLLSFAAGLLARPR